MKKISNLTRICPLCGRTINYTETYEDGTDWMGHDYGSPSTTTYGYECNCDKTKFKRMCYNCKFYRGNDKCVNSEVSGRYKEIINKTLESEPFKVDMMSLVVNIKDATKVCQCWQLSDSIKDKLFPKN